MKWRRMARMTKPRKQIIERMAHASLQYGFTAQGGREYYFSGGSEVNQSVVSRMIDAGILEIPEVFAGMPSQHVEIKNNERNKNA